jgi:hypothetical protein
MLIPMLEVAKWKGKHHTGSIENGLTAKAISLSSITARVKSNGVACRHQTKNEMFRNR